MLDEISKHIHWDMPEARAIEISHDQRLALVRIALGRSRAKIMDDHIKEIRDLFSAKSDLESDFISAVERRYKQWNDKKRVN